MRTIPIALQDHLLQETTTTATCWLVELQDGRSMGFTDHVDNLQIDGVTYEAATGYTPSAVQTKYDLSVSNLELAGVVDSAAITTDSLAAGVFDFASVTIFKVNYESPEAGSLVLLRGKLGEVTYSNSSFKAELRSITQQLQQTIGEVYAPSCRAIFGDSRCKIDLAAHTKAGSVVSLAGETSLVIDGGAILQPDGWYTGGLIAFTSGANAGLKMEVSNSAGSAIELCLPMPHAVAAGDTFTIVAGCLKDFQRDCKNKFANVVNFRGEPWVPGVDSVLRSSYRPADY